MPVPDFGGSNPPCTTLDDTCPEGQKCMPYANDGGSTWNAYNCFDVQGDGTYNEPCTAFGNSVDGLDDCARGHMCLHNHCMEFCGGTVEMPICPPKHHCPIAGDGVFAVCFYHCDPLLQDCMSPGFGCFVANGGTWCFASDPDVGKPVGEPCVYTEDCDLGLQCLSPELWPDCAGESGCCAPLCDLNNPDCATPGTMCVPALNDPEPWLEHIGRCQLPG